MSDIEREIADLLRRQVMAQERIAAAAESEASKMTPKKPCFGQRVEGFFQKIRNATAWQ